MSQRPPRPPISDPEQQQQQRQQQQQQQQSELVIYEPFLYDLSPTWDAWCFLQAAQVHSLVRYHDMGGG